MGRQERQEAKKERETSKKEDVKGKRAKEAEEAACRLHGTGGLQASMEPRRCAASAHLSHVPEATPPTCLCKRCDFAVVLARGGRGAQQEQSGS